MVNLVEQQLNKGIHSSSSSYQESSIRNDSTVIRVISTSKSDYSQMSSTLTDNSYSSSEVKYHLSHHHQSRMLSLWIKDDQTGDKNTFHNYNMDNCSATFILFDVDEQWKWRKFIFLSNWIVSSCYKWNRNNQKKHYGSPKQRIQNEILGKKRNGKINMKLFLPPNKCFKRNLKNKWNFIIVSNCSNSRDVREIPKCNDEWFQYKKLLYIYFYEIWPMNSLTWIQTSTSIKRGVLQIDCITKLNSCKVNRNRWLSSNFF